MNSSKKKICRECNGRGYVHYPPCPYSNISCIFDGECTCWPFAPNGLPCKTCLGSGKRGRHEKKK